MHGEGRAFRHHAVVWALWCYDDRGPLQTLSGGTVARRCVVVATKVWMHGAQVVWLLSASAQLGRCALCNLTGYLASPLGWFP